MAVSKWLFGDRRITYRLQRESKTVQAIAVEQKRDRSNRNAQTPGCLGVRVPLLDKRNGALP